MGASYEVADKNVCIEYLTVEKHSLAWRNDVLRKKSTLLESSLI